MTTALLQEQEDPRIPRDTFAVRLAMIRAELQLNVSEAAKLCEIPAATWATWEKGSLPRDLPSTATKIANATGYHRDWVIRGGFPLRAKRELTVIQGGGRRTERARTPLLRVCD